jgi:hypothetical protein
MKGLQKMLTLRLIYTQTTDYNSLGYMAVLINPTLCFLKYARRQFF